jgi:hypothetical protein
MRLPLRILVRDWIAFSEILDESALCAPPVLPSQMNVQGEWRGAEDTQTRPCTHVRRDTLF